MRVCQVCIIIIMNLFKNDTSTALEHLASNLDHFVFVISTSGL